METLHPRVLESAPPFAGNLTAPKSESPSDPSIESTCAHCALPIPLGTEVVAKAVPEHSFCCHGCASVWQMIQGNGLEAYYQRRDVADPIPVSADKKEDYSRFDRESLAKRYIKATPEGWSSANLMVEDIHCAACIWLIEQFLLKQEGIVDVSVNFGTHRAHVVWDPEKIRLSEVLHHFLNIGYAAQPYDKGIHEQKRQSAFRQMIINLAVAAFCAGNVMMLSVSLYTGYFSGIEDEYRFLFESLSGLLTIPIVTFSALPFWKGAWRAFKHRQPNMDLLVSIGISVTFIASTVALMTGATTYFDSCAMIVFFLLISRTLEHLTKTKVASITERLTQLTPQFVSKLDENDQETNIPVEDVQVQDRLLIREGDVVPVDGVVQSGQAEIDDSVLTGESQWRFVTAKAKVLGGSQNRSGSFIMETSAIGEETVLNRVVRLVEDATRKKTKIQTAADRVASWFVWAILALTMGTWAYWGWVGTPELQPAWLIAVSVVIIACPCALSLATPTAILAGTGIATQKGMLVKGADVLERAAGMTDVIFDKTGTLTTGEMEVVDVQNLSPESETEWWPLVLGLESGSNHPIAHAIRRYASDSYTSFPLEAQKVEVLPGRGLSGIVEKQSVLIGNSWLMQEEGIELPSMKNQTESTEQNVAHIEMWIAIDGILKGRLVLSDCLRADAASTIALMKKMNVRPHILSGDRQTMVAHVAELLGIEEAHGQLMPDQKLAYIQELQEAGKKVMMVGDGVNDAPSLQQADLGMAVGKAADIALDAADVVLMNSRLQGAFEFLGLSKKTIRTIWQNLGISLGYNALTIPLAMMGLIHPLIAALTMAFSSIFVTLNALRLRHSQR